LPLAVSRGLAEAAVGELARVEKDLSALPSGDSRCTVRCPIVLRSGQQALQAARFRAEGDAPRIEVDSAPANRCGFHWDLLA